jgi:hypothetical protein
LCPFTGQKAPGIDTREEKGAVRERVPSALRQKAKETTRIVFDTVQNYYLTLIGLCAKNSSTYTIVKERMRKDLLP